MSSDRLSAFVRNCTKNELDTWFKRQQVLARALCSRLQRFGAPKAEVPEPAVLVNETFLRILEAHGDKYVWDGTGSLDAFFRASMKITAESLRSIERRHTRASIKFKPGVDVFTGTPGPTPHEFIEMTDVLPRGRELKRVLATVIAETRVGPSLRIYMEQLHRYAGHGFEAKDIAADLGVKPTTVDKYRERARSILASSMEKKEPDR